MARLLSCGFEFNSTTSGIEFDSSSGTVSISTTTVRSGTYALRANPAASTGYVQHLFQLDTVNTTYHRFYVRVASLPSGTTAIWQYLDGLLNVGFEVRMTTAGALQLFNLNGGAAQVGSDSSALSTGQWYRIEVKVVDHATNAAQLELKIDGTIVASGSSLNGLNGGGTGRWGVMTSCTADIFFDDIAVNNTSGGAQTSYPGAGNIIRLKPNATGDVNSFGDQRTGGTAGSTNDFTRVNEVTPNDATSFNGSTTLNQEGLYNVDASGIGASDTVNVVEVWSRFRNNTADTAAVAKLEIEKTASGTILQSGNILPNSTTWRTNVPGTTQPKIPALVTYTDPDGAAWTQTTLDSAQIGCKLTTAPAVAGRRIDFTNISMVVDYTPAVVVSTFTPIVVMF